MSKDEIKTLLATVAVGLPVGFAWLFYGKDTLRWLVANGTAITWTVAALAAIVAVVFIVAKLSARPSRRKRYGTLSPEIICTLLKK